MTDHQPMMEQESTERLTSTPIIISLILFICLASFIRWNLDPRADIPQPDQNTQFSATSAKQMLSDVLADESPHPLDSMEIRQTEKRLVKILRKLGYQEEIQEAKVCDDNKWGVRCTQVRNIIVTINGTGQINSITSPSETAQSIERPTGILISSHYDSVDAGPGAGDAGVAVATMLEIARLLSTMPQPKNTIVLLFNEGEEYGLLGAKAFMQQHPLAKKLKLAINVEARGSKGSSVMFETGENSGWLVQEYLKQSPKVLSSSLFYEVYKALPNDTDLTVFKKHGLQGLNFAHAEKLTHYHTPLDNLENLELATIQHHGDNVWRILQTIKDQNLNDPNLTESNLVYTDILGLFSLEWQESTSITASILLLILFIFSITRLSKFVTLSKQSMRRGVYSFFIFLIILPVMGYLLQLLVTSISATNQPWLINSFSMQIALWSLLSVTTLIVGRLLLKNCQALSVMLGLVSCWIISSIATSYFIVGISFLFLIPTAISVLILFLYPYCINIIKPSALNLHFVISALVIAILFMPIVYTLEIMVTYDMTVALSVMFAFIMIGLLPTLTINRNRQLKRVQVTLLATFIIGTSWTALQPSFDSTSKQRINVYYLQDDVIGAYVATGDENNKPSEMLFEALDSPTLGSTLPWSNYNLYYKKINSENIQPSQIEILNSTSDEQNNTAQFVIQSTDQISSLREIRIYVPKESNIKTVTFLNEKYEVSRRKSNSKGYINFRCIGASCQSIKIELEKTSKELTEILVVTTLKGLPKALETYQRNRGEMAHQSQFGDQSHIVSRVEI